MLNKETLQKIASCKALQGMSVAELCATDRFRDNLAAYMTAQRTDRKAISDSYEAMHKLGCTKGYKLQAHAIDRCINMSVDAFTIEFLAVVGHTSKRPYAERLYIMQLGKQAYNLTVAQIVCEEYPELADELIPKSQAN